MQSTLVFSNRLPLGGTISQSFTHSRAPLLTYTVNLLAVYSSDDLLNRRLFVWSGPWTVGQSVYGSKDDLEMESRRRGALERV